MVDRLLTTIDELRALHHRAITRLDALVEDLSPADLARPTPCAAWNLADLVAHLIGQNLGFARALSGETTSAADYAPSTASWASSARALTAAVAGVEEGDHILLPEISPDVRFPAATAIGFQLVDSVIHGWDVARSRGQSFRPDDDQLGAVHTIAHSVPDGATGDDPHLPFGPIRPDTTNDPWRATLARLGRDPDWTPAPSTGG